MPTERIQRQIDRLLDEADDAVRRLDWLTVRDRAEAALALDRGNADALDYLSAAQQELAGSGSDGPPSAPEARAAPAAPGRDRTARPELVEAPSASGPTSFCGGRYEVVRFLGEGAKKRVYLVHDTRLDRDVAFALLKTDGLDLEGQARVRREAQAMARVGDHPHIVAVYDIGDEDGQPYLVAQLMAGGSLEDWLQRADDHRLPLDQALQLAGQVCQALEHAHSHGIIHRDLKPGNVWLMGGPGVGVQAPEVTPPPQPSPARGEGGRAATSLALTASQPSPARGEGGPVPDAWPPLVAKLGDFGLALSLDRSRLTQAGMMVGTVSYMSPEQALGGEVTPRSDLYSLGAMLYEMVTGRPPFVGDESVAIITQHLNTPPVAPSWHRPDVSTGLETLVLRLLEKDPAKRPASAAEVRQMLATASPPPQPSPARGEGVSYPPPSEGEGKGGGRTPEGVPPNPVYRRTFVGREGELRQLHAAFDAALSGQGGLVMVVGEPGIGKTSLCEQLATYVALRGGKALVGHCYEEGSLSLPYLPFVEAMRSYVLARDPEGLKTDLGTGAAEVARIVSEIQDRLTLSPGPSPNPSASSGQAVGGGVGVGAVDPDEQRWRLLQAVTGFLRNASSVQPLLLVLEDLHDADRGTLDLLVHLSRNLEGARLLIAGTYRDVEVDRGHPLSGALADLRRSANFLRVPLRGLTAEEVQRMMVSVAQRDIPWAFAELLHRQTEGNPLFVQEMLRYLVEEGLVAEQQGALRRVGDESLAGRIPEGLRDVIGKRLSRLAERTNQVLSVAAVIGREFRLDVLQRIASLTDDELDTALEQAQERAIVEPRSTVGALVFRFTHAFFRQTLYEEIFASRRLRLHQQVARALEGVYGRRVEDHAAELAEHFAQSTDPADLEKALHYSELAAQRSMQVFAYGEAVRQLDGALKLQEVLDPDDALKRCDLLLAMAEALLPTEEPARVASVVAPEAFALAEKAGDSERAARAAIAALEALVRAGEGFFSGFTPEFQEWARRADRHAAARSISRVYADVHMGVATIPMDRAEAHRYLRRATELAEELAEPRAYFAAAAWALRRLHALKDHDTWQRVAVGVLTRPREGARSADLGICLRQAGESLLEQGNRSGADAVWRDLADLARRTRDASLALWAKEPSAVLAFLEGRLEEAAASFDEVHAEALALGLAGAGETRMIQARAFLYLGRADAVQTLLAAWGTDRVGRAELACVLAYLGQAAEAQKIRGEYGDIGADEDESSLHILAPLLEAAVLIRDESTARELARRLAPLAGLSYQEGSGGGYGRLLGGAAALLGEPEQARAYYLQAIAAAEKIGFRPEIALTRLELAELLLEEAISAQQSAISTGGGQEGRTADQLKAERVKHLDFAIEELRSMKMQPALERALRLKGLHSA